ncbi:hypothetical protein ERO13_A07G137500v2 [Gossypium hirsutum]|nr:hypothetical protein ERO13_A07G137500v2 [Gossypium hirsutum]
MATNATTINQNFFLFFLLVLHYIRMLCCRYALPLVTKRLESVKINQRPRNTVESRNRIGTISKSAKLVTCVKQLSNVKEEVYGALDSFITWELEFPLITVKKALKILQNEQEWKRIIQVIKWMLSKGQRRTMGTYFTLLNALAEDERLEEAEELTPRIFFDKMISIYYHKDMHEKMFELCFFFCHLFKTLMQYHNLNG